MKFQKGEDPRRDSFKKGEDPRRNLKPYKVRKSYYSRLLRSSDISQKQLSRDLGIPDYVLCRLQIGRSRLTLDEADKIACHFGVTLNDLLENYNV